MVSSTTLSPYYFGGALASLFASLFVLFSYAKFPSIRRHPSSLILWRSVLDVVLSVCFILLYLWDGAKDNCGPLGFVFQVAVLGSPTFTFMVAVDLLAALRNPFRLPEANLPRYHAFVWSSSLGSAVLLLATGSFDFRTGMQVCWIENNGSGRINALNWLLFFLPVLFYYVGSVLIVGYATKRLKAGLEASFSVRQRVLRNGQRYVLAFVLYWSAAIGVYAAVYRAEDDDSSASDSAERHLELYAVLAVLIAVRGVVDVVVWSYNESVLAAYRRWWRGGRVADAGDDPQKTATTPGGRPDTEVGINRALRREVLTLTTRAICKSVAADRPLPRSLVDGNFPRTLSATGEDPNVRTVLLQEGGHRVPFHDYGTDVFAYLRARFGIAADEYVASVRGSDGSSEVMERYTEGASGSFFYFTADRRYLVKTLSASEAHSMLLLLPGYARHMENNPDALLTKFTGFHAVRLYGSMKYFVVMQSCIHTSLPIDQRYDLKGSWVNRHARPKVRGGRRQRLRRLADHGGGGVLKDGDLQFQVALDPETRRRFLEQCGRDARFLRDEGILDYSLLLGVHFARQPTMPVGPEAAGGGTAGRTHFQQVHGGVQASVIEGPLVFQFGIIDVLQRWDASKRAERAAKLVFKCVDGDGLSAIEPGRYCERFVEAMRFITEPPEAADEAEFEQRRLSFMDLVVRADTGGKNSSDWTGVRVESVEPGGGGGGEKAAEEEETEDGRNQDEEKEEAGRREHAEDWEGDEV